jgi:ribosome-binding protein aMBF1 (putative translation factor)
MDRFVGYCELCGMEAELEQCLFNDDKLMICDNCYSKQESLADYWYEVQREDGIL